MKERLKGSRCKKKAVSSTKRVAFAFEIETAVQQRVLRLRKEPARGEEFVEFTMYVAVMA